MRKLTLTGLTLLGAVHCGDSSTPDASVADVTDASLPDVMIDMVVAELNLTFSGSARFDDLVTIEGTIETLGTTSMTTRLELRRDGESLVQCQIRHVFVDTKTWSKTEIPDWLRTGLEPYLAASG